MQVHGFRTFGAALVVSDRSLQGISADELGKLLQRMMLIRRFEEKAAEMYARGRVKGFLHLYIGQEAVAVGVISRLQPQDYIFTHYREHGHALARGMDPDGIMAELAGKATGVSKGLGGSMHLFDVSRRFMGGYAIVAGHMPLACGAGLAAKRMGENAIVLCIIGDGAVNEGAFHESLNLAAIWKLPVLFLLENNFYGMGTPISRVAATPDIYKHAEVYGMRATRVDGMDIVKVLKKADEAIELVRSGEGPYFLETSTYRFRGHSMADPEFYRDKSEIEHWRQSDPIKRFSDTLLSGGHLNQEDIELIQGEVEEIVDGAARFADESPFPDESSLTDGIYAPSPLDQSPATGGINA
jgi:pyruvate dehydrogenase E1 component alpha subunit